MKRGGEVRWRPGIWRRRGGDCPFSVVNLSLGAFSGDSRTTLSQDFDLPTVLTPQQSGAVRLRLIGNLWNHVNQAGVFNQFRVQRFNVGGAASSFYAMVRSPFQSGWPTGVLPFDVTVVFPCHLPLSGETSPTLRFTLSRSATAALGACDGRIECTIYPRGQPFFTGSGSIVTPVNGTLPVSMAHSTFEGGIGYGSGGLIDVREQAIAHFAGGSGTHHIVGNIQHAGGGSNARTLLVRYVGFNTSAVPAVLFSTFSTTSVDFSFFAPATGGCTYVIRQQRTESQQPAGSTTTSTWNLALS